MVRWGEPRATVDVDLTLLTGLGREEAYVRELLGRFTSRVPDAEAFALKNRVLLVRAGNGVPVDIALGGIPFEENVIRRASPWEFAPGCRLVTCAAEDLVIFKAFADRPRDWTDIEGILVRQGRSLDWPYIREQLTPLCQLKEAPEIPGRLEQLRKKLGR